MTTADVAEYSTVRGRGPLSVNAITVACCQLAPVLGDIAANRELSATAISQAAAQGASVVVLPELTTSGYVFENRDEAWACAEFADGDTIALWAELAATWGIVVVGGFCESSGDTLFNSAVLVDRTGPRCFYRKAHLWDKERLWFSPGEADPPVVDTEFGRIGVLVCYDLEFPEWVRLPALDGAQLLCAPVNWPSFPRPAGERPAEVIRVQADAAVNRMFIAVCDRMGKERGVEWISGSIILDADGWPLAATPEAAGHAYSGAPYVSPTSAGHAATAAGKVIISASCLLDEALDKTTGQANDVHADRRPGLYSRVAAAAAAGSGGNSQCVA
jgi:5-aminopentanamidase